MSKFSQIDEKNFLESYAEYIVNVRPYFIKILCDKYKSTSDLDEKNQLFLLVFEQFFLFYETLEGFFRAVINRHSKPFLDSLVEDLNIQNIYEALKNKDDSQILSVLKINLDHFDKKTKNKIEERITHLAGLWRRGDFYKAMKNLIPLFNKIKHKLLVLRNENGIYQIILEDQQKPVEDFFEEYKDISNISNDNIDYFLDMAERIKCAIQDLIAIRLLEINEITK
jgi:hypothetical protein